jgi:hypothetical protein
MSTDVCSQQHGALNERCFNGVVERNAKWNSFKEEQDKTEF